MPDHRLRPLTPLGGAQPASVTIGPVTITEIVDTALASLAIRRDRAGDVMRAAGALGLPLPGPGRAETGPAWSAFWLGPEQWMVEAPFESHEDIAAHLRRAFGDAASITEQTDAWVRFDLTGYDLAALLERLCVLDPARLEPGAATRTMIDHLGCSVIRRAPDRLSILGPRSAAASLHHALVAAARSVF